MGYTWMDEKMSTPRQVVASRARHKVAWWRAFELTVI
jgi:hypothetical protein